MKIKNFDPEEWGGIDTASKAAGVSHEWMRKLAQDGKVRAVRIDGLWFVHLEAARAFERDPAGRGRPRS